MAAEGRRGVVEEEKGEGKGESYGSRVTGTIYTFCLNLNNLTFIHGMIYI